MNVCKETNLFFQRAMASVYIWKKDQIAQRYFIYSGNKKSQFCATNNLLPSKVTSSMWRVEKETFGESPTFHPCVARSYQNQIFINLRGLLSGGLCPVDLFLLSLFRYGIGDTTNGGLDQVVYVNITNVRSCL